MNSQNENITSVNALFTNAVEAGNLSPISANIFNSAKDIGTQIQAALGTPVDQIPATDMFLVSLLLDDSGSIRWLSGEDPDHPGKTISGEDLIIWAHNMILEDILKESKHKANIMLMSQLLNGRIINPFTLASDAKKLDHNNYSADGGTPLYDMSIKFMGAVRAKELEFRDAAVPVKTVSLILTDGHDEHSHQHGARDVAQVVKEMLTTSEDHIIAAMGFNDGRTPFKQIFQDMGIDDKWTFTPQNRPREIGKALRLFSQSVSAASKNAQSFSKIQEEGAAGGFGA